ncbi:MAG: signal peptidase I [Proteobacteria bacterium]|nr:signal peptidase I [Pseudomonadota bacterium]
MSDETPAESGHDPVESAEPVHQEAVSPAEETPPPPPAPPAPPQDPKPGVVTAPAPKKEEGIVETIKTIVYALLIALVIRTFLFQPFYIPSGSMEATLLVGDYLFIEKFAYGYSRNSFPFSAAPFSGRIFASQPKPGDVIVFKMPNENSPHYMDDYIKRLIGMPGDRIQMINDRLYINGKIVPRVREGNAVVECPYFLSQYSSVPQYRETLPNGVSYLTADCTPNGDNDNTGVFVVPPGHYFMMGDNRDNSDDSRGDVGYVPFDNLVGRAEIRFFSIDDSAHWFEPWTWPGAIRFSRMFSLIR